MNDYLTYFTRKINFMCHLAGILSASLKQTSESEILELERYICQLMIQERSL